MQYFYKFFNMKLQRIQIKKLDTAPVDAIFDKIITYFCSWNFDFSNEAIEL